jgi:hypothetical protein
LKEEEAMVAKIEIELQEELEPMLDGLSFCC